MTIDSKIAHFKIKLQFSVLRLSHNLGYKIIQIFNQNISSSRGSPSNRKSSENFLKSDSAETPPIVDNLLLTPKNSTVGGSLIGSVIAEEEEEEEEDEEEDEELEFELSEEDIDEELAILAIDSPICE